MFETKKTKKVSKEIRESIQDQMGESAIRQIIEPKDIPDDKKEMVKQTSVLSLIVGERGWKKVMMIGEQVGNAISTFEEQVIFYGNGKEQNANVIGINNVLQNKKELCHIVNPVQAWRDITFEDIKKVIEKVDKKYREDSAWYCSQEFADKILNPFIKAFDTGQKITDKGFINYPVKIIKEMSKIYKRSGEVCCLFGNLNEVVTIYEGKDMEVGETISQNSEIVNTYNRYDIDLLYELKDIKENGPIAGLIVN